MHYERASLIGMALLIATAMAPAFAQDEAAAPAGPSNERIKQVIVYGSDPCPKSTGGEILVCARQDEKERYRIPEPLRREEPGSTKNEAWTSRVRSIEYVGRTGTDSCTPAGLGGFTGCFNQIAARAKAERAQSGDKSWADLVAAEREKRLSKIDADSQKIEERVKAEEAAQAKAEAEKKNGQAAQPQPGEPASAPAEKK